MTQQPRVCIVGAGMSGMLMAIKLLRSGRENFVIFEKTNNVGGTWRENRYPGVACDVASFSYCYDFEPNPNWTYRFSPGPEIQKYFEGVAKKYNLDKYIQYETEVTRAEYKEDQCVWEVETDKGDVDTFEVFVVATGPLNKKKYPDIKGIDDFKNTKCHTADWADDYDYTGKKVGIIGSGSSSVQSVSPLSDKAGKLTIFQRTPQWVVTTPNPEYSKVAKWLKNKFPVLGYMTRHFYLWVGDQFGKAALTDGWRRKFVQWACEAGLKHQVKDAELREKITPTDLAMCRRMIMSGTYFPALNREHVHVETTPIMQIEETGVRTTDGTLHEIDLLVLATGFYPNHWNILNVIGEGGKTFTDAWHNDKTRTYRSITMPGFPNYFMLIGPNSPITNLSLVEIADIGVDYVIQVLERIEKGELKAVAPKAEEAKAFNQLVNDSFDGTIWVTGCNSWYIDEDGDVQTWPWAPMEFRKSLDVPKWEDYDITPA